MRHFQRTHVAATLAAGLLLCCADLIGAAEIQLRRTDGQSQLTAELGEVIDFEVVIDPGEEEITGYSFWVSFDSRSLRLVQKSSGAAGSAQPFFTGSFLGGIVLLNQFEQLEDEIFLSYSEAASVQRSRATEPDVAATFALEVVRRPFGDSSPVVIEQRGHDRFSHYVTAGDPGIEKRFVQPLGSVELRITGFRILPLPDVVLVEGEADTVFKLDDFVDQEGAEVVWSSQSLSQIPTTILVDSNAVAMIANSGAFGSGADRNDSLQMAFTAFEMNEGLTATDTISVVVRARPEIDKLLLPATISFPEDEINQSFNLDAFVTDADDALSDLIWQPTGGTFLQVNVDRASHVATFRPAPNWFGVETIELTVTDPTGLSDRATLSVAVTSVNDPPRIQQRGPVYPAIGDAPVRVQLSDLIQDVDDDLNSLTILHPAQNGVSVQRVGDALEITGIQAGRAVIELSVHDLSAAADSGRQVAVVLERGQTVGPQIARLPELHFKNGELGTLDLNQFVMDVDEADANLKWSPAVGDELSPLSIIDGRLTVGADEAFVGQTAVELTVSDSDGNEDRAILPITVIAADEAASPVIFPVIRIGIVSGEDEEGAALVTQVDLNELVADPDNADSELTWTADVSKGVSAELDEETNTLFLTAISGLFGVGTLNLQVEDPGGNTDFRSIPTLIVEPGAAPRVAEFDPVVVDSLAAAVRIDLDDFVFDDEDLDSELVWTVGSEPGLEVELDPVSHILAIRREDPDEGPPASSRVQLVAIDTDGQESRPVFIQVGLPPIFQLTSVPDIEFFTGDADTSLVLDDHVTNAAPSERLDWKVAAPQNLQVLIDRESNRVHVVALDAGFVGGETLLFTATDKTGRSRTAPVRVIVKSRGLVPEIRQFEPLQIRAGEADSTTIDLDAFVVDDDPDSVLTWSFTPPLSLTVSIDSTTNQVTVAADELGQGTKQVQFLVSDPAGNTDLGVLEVTILRGGEPPVISSLPQVFVAAGAPEVQLDLDLFIEDPDTPDDEIDWQVGSEAGVSARLDIDTRHLLLSVPPGQDGTRKVTLTATDPMGNQVQAELMVIIESDSTTPTFALELRRHPVITDRLELAVTPSEELMRSPVVKMAGEATDVTPGRQEGTFAATYVVPAIGEPQSVQITVEGSDLAGNVGTRDLLVVLQRMDEEGGSLPHPDGLRLNVPDAAAGPGRLAIIYRLGEEERPADAEGQQVYFVDLAGGSDLLNPVTLNLYAGSAAQGTGLLRRDPDAGLWDELPTIVDQAGEWLTISITASGLYRLGSVSAANTRSTQKLASHPNPFSGAGVGSTQIEYELLLAGPVRLQVFNVLGQRVKLLVTEEFQEAGVWTVLWDGRDDDGLALSNGMYFYELTETGSRNCRRLLLIR